MSVDALTARVNHRNHRAAGLPGGRRYSHLVMRQPHTPPKAVHDDGLVNLPVRDVRTERMDPPCVLVSERTTGSMQTGTNVTLVSPAGAENSQFTSEEAVGDSRHRDASLGTPERIRRLVRETRYLVPHSTQITSGELVGGSYSDPSGVGRTKHGGHSTVMTYRREHSSHDQDGSSHGHG